MRIAVVLNTSWNIYNFRMNLIKSLQERGHEVHTVAPNDEYTNRLIEAGCTHHEVKMDSRGANPVKDFALIFELRSIYKRVKPDVILHYTIKPNVYGTLAAARLRIPVINNVCGLGTAFLKNDIISRVAIFLYRLSFRFARKVFFQNPDDLNLFLNKKLARPDAVDLLPGSGIDLKKFSPVALNSNAPFTFLLISRLITDKGVLEYVDAVKKLKAEGMNAKFQLLGAIDEAHKRGISKSLVNQWIQSGTIEYLGTTEDVRAFIEQAHCIVLPSYREGTPRTLLEAASSSRPIIATDVPGCNQVVDDQVNGFLCNMKDANDLADKMRKMANLDPQSLIRFGQNGRKKMEAQYDESIVINKYLEALSEIEAGT
ncbi:MAG: glycosyltransferase family 4 protein [Cyclobacteriaceae bacterium]|nr:glycosyltransferase family 4 protein [Cyclobacteriaceae bacterium]